MTYNGAYADDPYARPDLLPADETQARQDSPLLDPFGGEWTACACCGAEIPQRPFWDCALCGWIQDSAAEDASDMPSGQNDGLTLAQAQLHFQALGCVVRCV